MYFTLPPSDSTVSRTSEVSVTGEKTATDPVVNLTVVSSVRI